MTRDYYINGETLVLVKGNVLSGIPTLSQLGLADSPIVLSERYHHMDIEVDAWGRRVAPEIQTFLVDVFITMRLVHFDPAILDACWRESLAGAPAEGATSRAGARMGNNQPRFAAGNHFIGLNLTSPVGPQNIPKPWRFLYAYMNDRPRIFPLGTERSLVDVSWRAIPATDDPYGGGVMQPLTTFGTGAQGAVIWDHTLDS